jgi:pyridoxal phosphate-dependent aminotransferase EpsN
LIEDAAEALGATYHGRPAGSFGRAAVFSFNGNKIITTSGGGMMVSSDQELVERARFLATQARDPFPHYEHSHVGYNYRMSNLLAAVGRGQLAVLAERVKSRRRNFDFYSKHLGHLDGVDFMPEPEGYFSTRWLSALTIDENKFGTSREDLRLALEQHNIESRPVWKPMHMQPVFQDCRSRTRFVSETLFRDGLCLPSGSALTEEQLKRVVEIILECQRKRNPTRAINK